MPFSVSLIKSLVYIKFKPCIFSGYFSNKYILKFIWQIIKELYYYFLLPFPQL